MFVPVVDVQQKPLMPTTSARARKWIKSGKATPFWKRGVFCVRLNVEPSDRKVQDVVVGIDPGSKKEGFTVKSKVHTFLNIQADAVTWVKDVIETRRMMRRNRRYRTTPCRQPRFNRNYGGLPPSTKARWQWKLRVCSWLVKMYPLIAFVVEDIKVKSLGKRRWDVSFSPLQVGKKWFYSELEKLAWVNTKSGWDTKLMRDALGLKKTDDKSAEKFSAHCVDSWVLANSMTGGHEKPDNTSLLLLVPLRFHRRQLHYLQPGKGGIRRHYGGTRSLGFKRGSLIKHIKRGLTYVGGNSRGRLSLCSIEIGKRIYQDAKPEDCKFLTFNSWKAVRLPLDGVGNLRAA